jgi:hypothetical protein
VSTKPGQLQVLENFHYLDEERQKAFSFDLRTFQELNIQFVILGVWREKNRLVQFNGDLLDRIIEVPVEPWTEEEFDAVADLGSKHLNIQFSPEVIRNCADASFSSIGVFQELLKATCLGSGVSGPLPGAPRVVSDQKCVDDAIEGKAGEYAVRHQRALEAIAAGNTSSGAKAGLTPLYLTYYLIRVVLAVGHDGIKDGMKRKEIHEQIQKLHHRSNDVRPSDISNLLHNLAKTQANKNITPPIIDYDRTGKRLQVVDSTFHFFLKHANLTEIADELPSPFDSTSSSET